MHCAYGLVRDVLMNPMIIKAFEEAVCPENLVTTNILVLRILLESAAWVMSHVDMCNSGNVTMRRRFEVGTRNLPRMDVFYLCIPKQMNSLGSYLPDRRSSTTRRA